MNKFNARYYKITDIRPDPIQILLGSGYIGRQMAKRISSHRDFAYLQSLNNKYESFIEDAAERLGVVIGVNLDDSTNPILARSGLTQDLQIHTNLALMLESIDIMASDLRFAYNKEDAKIRQELLIKVLPDGIIMGAQELQADHILSMIDCLEQRLRHYNIEYNSKKLEDVKVLLQSIGDPSNAPLPPGDVRSVPLETLSVPPSGGKSR